MHILRSHSLWESRQRRKSLLRETQEEFAEHIDASKDTVSNIERCRVVPKMETLLKISAYTGVPLEELLGLAQRRERV